MKSLRIHFQMLLKKINPPQDRRDLARDLVRDLRDWLVAHEFETVDPHTLLIGSYARSTAVLWIKDVDVLVFLPKSALERTPNAVLLDLRKILEGYPGAVVSAVGQRRSIRIEFEDHGFFLDVVPAVAPDGLDEPPSPFRPPVRPTFGVSSPLPGQQCVSTSRRPTFRAATPAPAGSERRRHPGRSASRCSSANASTLWGWLKSTSTTRRPEGIGPSSSCPLISEAPPHPVPVRSPASELGWLFDN